MNVLCLFSGQGIERQNLFTLMLNDLDALDYINQYSQAASFDFLHSNLLLEDPNYSQIIIGVYHLALFHQLKPLLAHHHLDCAGYSLGEVSAFLASTQATAAAAYQVLSYRTQIMTSLLREQPITHYDLLFITGAFDRQIMSTLCQRHGCFIAIINLQQHLVLGGRVDDLRKVQQDLSALKVTQSKFLNIHLPSHTPFYQNKKGQLQCFLSSMNLNVLQYPIFNPLKGGKVYDSIEEQILLDQELYTPLPWDNVCQLISEYQYDLIIDLGPGQSMTSLLKLTKADLNILTVAEYKSISGVMNAIRKQCCCS